MMSSKGICKVIFAVAVLVGMIGIPSYLANNKNDFLQENEKNLLINFPYDFVLNDQSYLNCFNTNIDTKTSIDLALLNGSELDTIDFKPLENQSINLNKLLGKTKFKKRGILQVKADNFDVSCRVVNMAYQKSHKNQKSIKVSGSHSTFYAKQEVKTKLLFI